MGNGAGRPRAPKISIKDDVTNLHGSGRSGQQRGRRSAPLSRVAKGAKRSAVTAGDKMQED